jgi:hypothetical protein
MMNQILFQRIPPPGAAAHDAEKNSAALSPSRIAGGTAARLHEQEKASSLPGKAPSSVGFTLRAQGGRITRLDDRLIPGANTAPAAIVSENRQAAQTAKKESVPRSSLFTAHQALLSLLDRIQIFKRRS